MKFPVLLLYFLVVVSARHVKYNNVTDNITHKSILLSCLRPDRSDSPFDKLSQDGQPVRFTVSQACSRKTTATVLTPASYINHYLATASCQISNYKELDDCVILHGDEETANLETCGSLTNLHFRAMLLVQLPNMVTYIILDPNKGHWLFSNGLSGCDIFIAIKDSQPAMPLVVHANADRLREPEEQVENLQVKGIAVDTILGRFERNYNLKVRIHITPEGHITREYLTYWDNYRATHPGVRIFGYNVDSPERQFFQFYGLYTGSTWSFFLKGTENGAKTIITYS